MNMGGYDVLYKHHIEYIMKSIREIEFLKDNNYCLTPKVIQMEVTRECPLNCPQCYKDLSGRRHMDLRLMYTFLWQLANISPIALMINGGEPLLYPYLEELISFINSNRISGYIYTSGYNIENISIDILKKVNIDISLNGSIEKINKISRDGFDISVNAMRYLQEKNVKYGITWVARHDNVSDFPNMLELAKKYGAEHIQIIENKAKSDGTVVSELDKKDYKELIDYIHSYENNENIIRIFRQQCFRFLHVAEGNKYTRLFNGCMAGILSCAINLEGYFFPCMHISQGEYANTLMEYWNGSSILKKLREINYNNIAECLGCKHVAYCHFCKAVEKGTSQDFMKGPSKCNLKDFCLEPQEEK